MSVFLVLRMKKRLLRSELRVVPPIGMYLVASAMKGWLSLFESLFWRKRNGNESGKEREREREKEHG